MGISGEANAAWKGEIMSPSAQLFHAPTLNCYVVAHIGCKTRFNLPVIIDGLRHSLVKHPRFSSKMVKKGRTPLWIPTTVELEKHVIVPEIDPNLDFPDRFLEDYASNLTTTPLDFSRPLWEIHLLNIKTRDSEAVAILRVHHSLGDGASLISLLLSATRKTSDPQSLPTIPTKNKRSLPLQPSSPFSSFFYAIFSALSLFWNTLVDMTVFFATILFLRDTQTPIKGFPGVEHSTKRFVYRTVSLDDIKLVKNAMKVTINDVLLGITQAGLARYLNRIQGGNQNGGSSGPKQGGGRSDELKGVRLRAAILFNVRPTAGIEELADMMAEKSKVKWGNWIGYIILPFRLGLQEGDPLKYVRVAKSIIDRKKHSLEAICTFGCAKLSLKLFGLKLAAAVTHRVLYNTTLTFSNVVGPMEEISFCGHPVTFLAPTVYGHPHALTIHFLSYVNKMTISMAVEPSLIPDPHLLCDDLEASLKQITDVVNKTLILPPHLV